MLDDDKKTVGCAAAHKRQAAAWMLAMLAATAVAMEAKKARVTAVKKRLIMVWLLVGAALSMHGL
jgi:hypothetical protein